MIEGIVQGTQTRTYTPNRDTDFWYDRGGTLGVYDAGVDIPMMGASDFFHRPYSPHEEGARSVTYRGAAAIELNDLTVLGQTISANSEATAIVGFDMHDSGREFSPSRPDDLDADGDTDTTPAVVIETISKNLPGGVYTLSLAGDAAVGGTVDTLSWNGGAAVDIETTGDGRYIIADGGLGAAKTFVVVLVDFSEIADADTAGGTIDVTVIASDDGGRDAQQPDQRRAACGRR